ncbi:MAG: hypothetical protein PWP23_660 [Candidatus Sumerlaeota bacterium]|nr:hypothetical protein [Candidatus Sumerlaeota bacterium]
MPSPENELEEKSPQRHRREEFLLLFWRLLLLLAAIWAGVYAWIDKTWPAEKLEALATDTPHGALQFGVCLFLGIELAYYLYLSASFRRCREWGMAVWALGLLMVILNWKLRI